jgi:hypothetical protein
VIFAAAARISFAAHAHPAALACAANALIFATSPAFTAAIAWLL